MRSMIALGLALFFATQLVQAGEPVSNAHGKHEATQAAVAPGQLFGVADSSVFSGSTFYRINPSNGTATLIGSVGFTGVSGMAFDPFSGVLYARGRRILGTEVLVTINPTTGAGAEVGPSGTTAFVQDLSFRNSDGALFGYSDGTLIGINTVTGAQTTIASGCALQEGNGMAFSPGDTLYRAGTALDILNLNMCASTSIGTLRFPAGLGIRPRVAAMDFLPGTFTLFATVITGSGFLSSGPAYLATIDTMTGDVTIIGPTARRMDALAWSPPPPIVTCLQDETNGAILQVNSATGAYQFTNCESLTIGGVGTMTRRGCLLTLEVNGPERRILARIDTCMRNGVATVQVFAPSRTFTILDRKTSNSTCVCSGG